VQCTVSRTESGEKFLVAKMVSPGPEQFSHFCEALQNIQIYEDYYGPDSVSPIETKEKHKPDKLLFVSSSMLGSSETKLSPALPIVRKRSDSLERALDVSNLGLSCSPLEEGWAALPQSPRDVETNLNFTVDTKQPVSVMDGNCISKDPKTQLERIRSPTPHSDDPLSSIFPFYSEDSENEEPDEIEGSVLEGSVLEGSVLEGSVLEGSVLEGENNMSRSVIRSCTPCNSERNSENNEDKDVNDWEDGNNWSMGNELVKLEVKSDTGQDLWSSTVRLGDYLNTIKRWRDSLLSVEWVWPSSLSSSSLTSPDVISQSG